MATYVSALDYSDSDSESSIEPRLIKSAQLEFHDKSNNIHLPELLHSASENFGIINIKMAESEVTIVILLLFR
jgi:hypothetical protein